jgi:medium-chain acyl-[acyl-carrier-protein] hydrolase
MSRLECPSLPFAPRSGARVRLFVLPFVGGAAVAYFPWREAAWPHFDVCPIELPGRGARFREPPFRRMSAIVGEAADALTPHLSEPFALFGHSMGALVAYELAQALRRMGAPLPRALFASGRVAPHVVETRAPLREATDRELVRALRAFGGTPDAVFEHPELLDELLPVMRADFAACETYVHAPEAPLDNPVVVLTGRDDPLAPSAGVRAWRETTSGSFAFHEFAGGHFFLHAERAAVLAALRQALDDVGLY